MYGVVVRSLLARNSPSFPLLDFWQSPSLIVSSAVGSATLPRVEVDKPAYDIPSRGRVLPFNTHHHQPSFIVDQPLESHRCHSLGTENESGTSCQSHAIDRFTGGLLLGSKKKRPRTAPKRKRRRQLGVQKDPLAARNLAAGNIEPSFHSDLEQKAADWTGRREKTASPRATPLAADSDDPAQPSPLVAARLEPSAHIASHPRR